MNDSRAQMTDRRTRRNAGFTMVEMVVAVGVFTTLMLIITGAFLSIMDASRKERSTRIALDNVSGAIDYMAREIRLGAYFHCENDVGAPSIVDSSIMTPTSCDYASGGGNILGFERSGGSVSTTDDQLSFWHENGRLWRLTRRDGTVVPEALTAPELNVSYFRFFVDGTTYSSFGGPADQPRVTMVIRGVAGGGKVKTSVTFTLQTTLSARTPNIPPS